MRTPSLAILLTFLGILVSCNSNEARKLGTGERYKVLSAQKYGEGAEWIPNAGKTAVLCVKRSKPSAQHPQLQVAFFIFDISADRIVFEDDIPNGSVRWKDDQSVIVETVPGIERKDEPPSPSRHGYLLDIRTGKTRDLESDVVQ